MFLDNIKSHRETDLLHCSKLEVVIFNDNPCNACVLIRCCQKQDDTVDVLTLRHTLRSSAPEHCSSQYCSPRRTACSAISSELTGHQLVQESNFFNCLLICLLPSHRSIQSLTLGKTSKTIFAHPFPTWRRFWMLC